MPEFVVPSNWLAVLAICFASSRALANFPNYNTVVIGDQAAGMGGAYTAMSQDASAMSWYNPAALALLKGQSFSAAVGIYKKFDTLYNQDGDLTRASLQANQGFFRALPSATGNIIRSSEFLPEWTLGLSIVTPYYESFKGEVYNKGGSTSSLNLLDESLWVGGSLARKISSSEAMGLTLYYTARNYSRSVNDRTSLSSTQAKIYTEDRAYTQNAIVALLGYHRELQDHWKVGGSFRFSGWSVSGKGSYTDTTVDPSGPTVTTTSYDDVSTKARIPARYVLGVAYENPEVFSWALDLSYFPPYSYSDVEHDDIAEHLQHKEVWNIATGVEYPFRSWLKLRSGVFTNFSSHPDPDPTLVRGQGDHVDQLGFSANLAFLKGNIQYTFGGYYIGGWGRSVQRINQYQVVPKAAQVFTMLVGTTFVY